MQQKIFSLLKNTYTHNFTPQKEIDLSQTFNNYKPKTTKQYYGCSNSAESKYLVDWKF